MKATLLLEGNCANTIFLRAEDLLPPHVARIIDALIGSYARRVCCGVGFGQSNIIKALERFKVRIVETAPWPTHDEAAVLEAVHAVVGSAKNVIRCIEDYGFERGLHKSSRLVVEEAMRLLVLAHTYDADLWCWSPRLRVIHALLREAGATIHATDSPFGWKLHTVHVDGFPHLPSMHRAGAVEFSLVEFDAMRKSPIVSPRRVLFFSSLPRDQQRLYLDVEWRKIRDEVSRVQPGLAWSLELAARPEDLERALLGGTFNIVHFAGHATSSGIVLQAEDGTSRTMSYDYVAELLKNSGVVECLILNACYTEAGIGCLAKYCKYVIGVPFDWLDECAVEFSHALYLALARNVEIASAYRIARERVASMALVPHEKLPGLFHVGERLS